MAGSWLTFICLASTWMFASGYYFWPFGTRSVGFYDDPCGPTLYRMRAQGVPDLPSSMFIPPRRGGGPKRQPPAPTQAAPQKVTGNRTSSDVVVVSPPTERPPPPRRPRPPTRRAPATSRPAAPRYPPYPQFRDPFNRPIDPWLALALDLDPVEYPEMTTLAPRAGEAPDARASVRPRRVQRQAGTAPADPPATAASPPPRRPARPARPAARRPGGRTAPVECYCDSHWDCNGPARARGGRYDPQCDSGYGLVCCCR